MQTNKFRQRVFPAEVGLSRARERKKKEEKGRDPRVQVGVRGRVYEIRRPLRRSREIRGGFGGGGTYRGKIE